MICSLYATILGVFMEAITPPTVLWGYAFHL